jgi:CRP/FNR family transcriptional regulator, nitrogen oxide reductase regulator
MSESSSPLLDVKQLQTIPLFHGLTAAEIEEIAKVAQFRHVEADEYFFYQGDEANRIFVLADGHIKLTQLTPEGDQILLRVIGPWTLFGGVVMARGQTYPATAQAAEAAAALVWIGRDIMALIDKYPRLAVNAMQLMANNLQEFQARYRELATERVERRLARTLLRLASQTGKKIPSGVLIDLPLSRQDLAEMSGTTLFTVSRILNQWEGQGLVSLGRERVVILYPHGLVSIADDF